MLIRWWPIGQSPKGQRFERPGTPGVGPAAGLRIGMALDCASERRPIPRLEFDARLELGVVDRFSVDLAYEVPGVGLRAVLLGRNGNTATWSRKVDGPT
jgi:hypothetical protein